jgi:Ras GTPase-activating-like protein IQGAP2/3
LDAIRNSLNDVPYGIRWICHLIRQLAAKKFPETPQSTIATLVGAFFMLRFINPAVISPEAYYLIDTPPSKNPKRILTLV